MAAKKLWLTSSDVEELKRLYAQKLSIRAIAARLGFGHNRMGDIIRHMIRQGNLGSREIRGGARFRESEIIAYWNAGKSKTEIMTSMKVCWHSMSDVINSLLARGIIQPRDEYALVKSEVLNDDPQRNRNRDIRACLEHWRDLDREHPQGWGSYRVPPHTRGPSYHEINIAGV